MFSKALFKQSAKANGFMWAIITFAVCFMLACVMLISGGGNIGKTKDAIEDTIVKKEVEASLKERTVNYYIYSDDGLEKFDELYIENVSGNIAYLGWLNQMPKRENFGDDAAYNQYLAAWAQKEPQMVKQNNKDFKAAIDKWKAEMPTEASFNSTEEYTAAIKKWNALSPANAETAAALAYNETMTELTAYVTGKVTEVYNKNLNGKEFNQTDLDTNIQEITSLISCVIYPPLDETTEQGAEMKAYYDKVALNGDEIPEHYDVTSLTQKVAEALAANKSALAYVKSEERVEYRRDRAEDLCAYFVAVNMTDEANVEKLLNAIKDYGVDKAKYDSFGYDYKTVKHLAMTNEITYRNRLDYEVEVITDKYTNDAGEITDEAAYKAELAAATENLKGEITSSLLASLPDEVSEALKEVGSADLYTLIVGSIFYKLAGLLLPIIYMIMAANNLIAGQVDSGSMAYVLSTSTKRKTVVFTQALYLIGSTLAMFALTTVTGFICLAIVKDDVELTFGKLALLNVGAFSVLFALSGLCFLTSCWFDRSKRSMAIGGGLSIFALVAAMLGLFGSSVIPSVVRLDALNYFNYVTIISLFDVISIMDGTLTFLWKFAILIAIGLAGYIVGSVRFTKKDLPL